MAFYVIKNNIGYFLNPDLYAFIEKKNTLRAIAEAAAGKLESVNVFGQVLFPVGSLKAKKIIATLGIDVCDIDKQIKENLRENAGDDCMIDTIVPTSVYRYEGYEFVKFAELMLHDKYNKRDRMALIRVGGFLYVALDQAKRTCNGTAIVITEA